MLSLQNQNRYIVLSENKRSLFSRDHGNLKNYSKKCPALKSGFLRKMWLTPSRSDSCKSMEKITKKCLYYLGMAKNFRRVLNCVAPLCCEIEKMRKWPCDGKSGIYEIYTSHPREAENTEFCILPIRLSSNLGKIWIWFWIERIHGSRGWEIAPKAQNRTVWHFDFLGGRRHVRSF